ncbi:MAG: hypothetical protein K2Q12_03125 [Rickettsiales bacterium]|nr:hypothetical protein [Rickettsiales bacterium]
MHTPQPFISNTIIKMEQALERMPIRSSVMARKMVKLALPVPETRQDIERYILSLLERPYSTITRISPANTVQNNKY